MTELFTILMLKKGERNDFILGVYSTKELAEKSAETFVDYSPMKYNMDEFIIVSSINENEYIDGSKIFLTQFSQDDENPSIYGIYNTFESAEESADLFVKTTNKKKTLFTVSLIPDVMSPEKILSFERDNSFLMNIYMEQNTHMIMGANTY